MQKENEVIKIQVILNLIQDLQRLPLQLVNNMRGRSRIKYGMTALYTNSAFTLIELLVVVLIIGILAAVAVPQYQKAVLKSRFTTVMPMAKAVAQGNETYYLANGEYSDQLPELDVEKPAGDNSGVLVGLKNTVRYDYVLATREGLNNNYIIYQDHSPNFPQNIHCEAKSDDTQANWVCESLGGTQMDGSQTQNYTTYILQGNAEDGRLPKVYDESTNGQILYEGDVCIAYRNSSGNSSCVNTYKDGAKCDAQGNWRCNGTVFENGSVCNGQGWSSCRGTFDDSTCYARNPGACEGTFTNGSECIAIAMNQNCRGSSFVDSTCKGGAYNSCRGSSFKNSECLGNNENTCGGVYVKSTSFDNSTCYGNKSNSCSSATYTHNSTCIMNHSSACQSNLYANGGGCQNGTNGTCPAGTPQPGGWDATTQTYTPTGWNGGYCNPSAMTSGKCPAGSPTSTSGTCWDGDGNEITC